MVGAEPLDVGVQTIEASKTIGGLSIEREMQRLPHPITIGTTATAANIVTAPNTLGLTTQWAD